MCIHVWTPFCVGDSSSPSSSQGNDVRLLSRLIKCSEMPAKTSFRSGWEATRVVEAGACLKAKTPLKGAPCLSTSLIVPNMPQRACPRPMKRRSRSLISSPLVGSLACRLSSLLFPHSLPASVFSPPIFRVQSVVFSPLYPSSNPISPFISLFFIITPSPCSSVSSLAKLFDSLLSHGRLLDTDLVDLSPGEACHLPTFLTTILRFHPNRFRPRSRTPKALLLQVWPAKTFSTRRPQKTHGQNIHS